MEVIALMNFYNGYLNKKYTATTLLKIILRKKLIMTQEDEEHYNNTQKCWICEENIAEDKVRDHCHITGKNRGAPHKECNLQLKISNKLPVIFHNLEGYDGHIIFRELDNFDNINIKVIPKSTAEKYMSFIINKKIIFLNSMQFLKTSLDNLAKNLEDNDYKYLLSEFFPDKLEILKRKDAYPYEWIDDYRKFNYPRLPPKDAFYSRLNDGKRKKSVHISVEQHEHLQNAWQTFNFKTFRDFHDHYLKIDVLLLADIFKQFITTCLKYHNLDPSHYFSAPGLSWDAMLKMTKIQLEKIGDSDKHISIEDGIRGGICFAAKKHSKANDSTETKYHDMNNL